MENALIDPPAVERPTSETARPTGGPSARRGFRLDPRWALMLAVLLGASGAIRHWRDSQFRSLETESKAAPFPLKEIPRSLGGWTMVDGAETTLDPQIARIAGSSDHVVRTYENPRTGETASVLVLYGLASVVWGHTPEACYPAAGYKPVMPGRDVMIDVEAPAPREVPFREAIYGMFRAGAASYHDVYYSFRNADEWRPEMGSRWKRFRYSPGMFKIQVERLVKDAGAQDDSCYDLLAALVDEIETRLAAQPAAPAVASAD